MMHDIMRRESAGEHVSSPYLAMRGNNETTKHSENELQIEMLESRASETKIESDGKMNKLR